MLGSALLVAPVTDPGVDLWTVPLPEDDWVDVWSGEPVAAGVHNVAVPIDRIPVVCAARHWDAPGAVFESG